MPDRSDTESPGTAPDTKPRLLATRKQQAQEQVEKAQTWLERNRPKRPLLDLALRCYERDRDSDAAVVGAAVALRVFLFFVPLTLILVGVAGFVGDHLSKQDAADQIGVTGGLANQIDAALKQGQTARWVALITRVFGAIAGIIGAIGLLSIITNRVRKHWGFTLGVTVLLACAAAYAVAWFLVSWFLPRARSDPSALLPGAILTGLAIAGLQGFTQFYASDQLSHASQLYGGIGVAVVTLGWFFFIGRIFVASFVVNACTFERFGSLSEFVFGLPGLRRIPVRWPRIAHFFGLQLDDDSGDVREEIGGGS
jgi:uncharacterized BrkB/YihY/UPF0761 family membrane protein